MVCSIPRHSCCWPARTAPHGWAAAPDAAQGCRVSLAPAAFVLAPACPEGEGARGCASRLRAAAARTREKTASRRTPQNGLLLAVSLRRDRRVQHDTSLTRGRRAACSANEGHSGIGSHPGHSLLRFHPSSFSCRLTLRIQDSFPRNSRHVLPARGVTTPGLQAAAAARPLKAAQQICCMPGPSTGPVAAACCAG